MRKKQIKVFPFLFIVVKGIRDEPIFDVDWSTTQLTELDLTSTDLSENALLALFSTIPRLNFLSVAFCDGFTDKVN